MKSEILKKRILIVTIFIFSLICLYWIYFEYNTSENPEINTVNESVNDTGKIYVYVAGGVNSPGVYEVSKGTRIYEIIKKAGDTVPYADMKDIHLEKSVNEDTKIYIPGDIDKATTSKSLVNINTANEIELRILPGVGAATAKKILDYREEHGKFKSKEELKEISGIGEGKYNKLSDKITIWAGKIYFL